MFLKKILQFKFRKSKRPNTIFPEKKVDDDVHEDSAEIDGFMVKELEPCDSLKCCIVTWNKNRSTFYLYENRNPYSTSVVKGKLLLVARKFKCPSHIDYVMSLDPNDFSKESESYVGKLSSDYLGINFTIYENGHLPDDDDDAVTTKQINPILGKNFEVGQICYEFDELKSEGPRYSVHFIRCPPGFDSGKITALRNKTPKWNEDLQCLCFEIKFRVTYSKKLHQFRKLGKEEAKDIVLEGWRVGDTTAILVYQNPYSRLQAFAHYISGFRNYYNNKFNA